MLSGPRKTVQRARKLRKEMSLPEILLWRELRKRPSDLKFRKQHPAGPFVADFFCHEARLVVEVDGEAHDRGSRPRRDALRDRWFTARRFKTMRIPTREILADLESVIRGIVVQATDNNPPLKGEGDHAQHGGGVSALERDAASAAHPLPLTPLHHLPSAGGPPPPLGEEL
ncbi:MAG: endonuclease domain-containing protein [Sphingomonadaceae bacterium]|nr:endonuclease domain-containing protein [Sphingomonadaceae bacterium]